MFTVYVLYICTRLAQNCKFNEVKYEFIMIANNKTIPLNRLFLIVFLALHDCVYMLNSFHKLFVCASVLRVSFNYDIMSLLNHREYFKPNLILFEQL